MKRSEALHVPKVSEAFLHRLVDGLRSLAAAKDQHLKRGIVRFWADRLELRAYRISGNNGSASEVRARLRIGDRRVGDPSSQHSVGKTGNGVLFHDHFRITLQDGSSQHRKGCISSDAHDNRRPELVQYPHRTHNALHRGRHIPHAAKPTHAFDASCRKRSQSKALLRHQPGLNPLFCAYEEDFAASMSSLDFARNRNPRKQMPTCAAACDDHAHECQIRSQCESRL